MRRWRAWWRMGERERRWRGLGLEDGYGRRGEREARWGPWGEGVVDMGQRWRAWRRLGVCPRHAGAPPVAEVGRGSGKAGRGAHGANLRGDPHPHPRQPLRGRPGGHHAAGGMGGPPPGRGPGPPPPLYPPNPPPMPPGHPPPGLGHRSPPHTPPPPHREGKGHGQGEGKGQKGTLRQGGMEGPQV